MEQGNRVRKAPFWLDNVKRKALVRVEASPLTQGCAIADEHSLFALMIGFWPFVKAFPEIISSTYRVLNDDRAAQALAGMEKDERSHMEKWLQTCWTIGIDRSQLMDEPLPRMQRLIAVLSEDTKPHNKFLRFLGVEIIAESLSEALMKHEAFREKLGKVGQGWFEAHLHHTENASTAHERIAIRLAERHAGARRSETQFAQETLRTVILFIEAAAECHAHWTTVGAR